MAKNNQLQKQFRQSMTHNLSTHNLSTHDEINLNQAIFKSSNF